MDDLFKIDFGPGAEDLTFHSDINFTVLSARKDQATNQRYSLGKMGQSTRLHQADDYERFTTGKFHEFSAGVKTVHSFLWTKF